MQGFLRIVEPFGSILRQPPPPRAELGRHGPGWASKDRQAGWLGGSWLAGCLSCVLCVVCCDCVCACACARVCRVLCVAGKQGHEEGGLSNRAKCSARSRSSLRSLASLATLAKLARSARLRSLAAPLPFHRPSPLPFHRPFMICWREGGTLVRPEREVSKGYF